ncbi:Laminin EGF-like (Domains III and V) family protein [Acanthocheilonema viteae]
MHQWQFFILLYVEARSHAQTTDKVKQQWNTVSGITTIFTTTTTITTTTTTITTTTTTTTTITTPIPITSSSVKFFKEVLIHSPNDDVNAYCRNGGIMVGHGCICFHPYTGTRCLDFACAHGISVGIRYDPDSLFFNKPCICDEEWSGDLCDILKANQCNDRGELRNGHCHCAGHFFGSQCQYVSRCDHGKRKHGRCLCDDGWKGDYCHDIICQHGYPDINNKSESCVCPARFAGTHCDRCSQKGPKIRPYPECNIDITKSKAKQQRQETETQFRLRLTIMAATSFLLLFLVITMIFFHRRRIYKRQRSGRENLRQREYEIRKTILEKAARTTECLNVEPRTEYIEEEDRNRRNCWNHIKTNRRLSYFL